MICNIDQTAKGEKATCYSLKNKKGMEVVVSDFGATLVKVLVPDRDNILRDVVLGYDTVEGYEQGGVHFGATVGRVANRIGGAGFELNGKEYRLTKNDNQNTLHGGIDYYNKRMWKIEQEDDTKVVFSLLSPDGDQGFPGNLKIQVSYELTEEQELKIHYDAVSDQDTIINLTNHSYFNLSGHDSGSVLDQEVMICAEAFTEADAESIPTGKIVPVDGTPMDFRKKKPIGRDVEEEYEALIFGKGYDHNWVLDGTGMRMVAAMASKQTGISMEVYTDLPGMQFYTGNFLEAEKGKDGAVYGKRSGACFETQYFPDAIHKENFEGPVLKNGERYETTTVYKFV